MLIPFKKSVQSAVRKCRSKHSKLVSWAGESNKALLIPSRKKSAWEVTLRCDGVLMARVVDPVAWAAGKDCSDGKVYSKQARRVWNPEQIARDIDALLRLRPQEVAV